ncbi:MAG: hypothetical protein U0V75_02000 [Ferruginibacter sp.]
MKFFVITCLTVVLCNAALPQFPCVRLPAAEKLNGLLAEKPVYISPSSVSLKCNVTPAVKKRLLYLLNWRWTDEEKEGYLRKSYAMYKKMFYPHPRFYNYETAYDNLDDSSKSAFAGMEIEKLKWRHQYEYVDAGLILTAAKLALPGLDSLLQHSWKDAIHYPQWAVCLAMARMGDSASEKNIIKECSYDASLNGRLWGDALEQKVKKLVFTCS